jgi:hypothetical protein
MSSKGAPASKCLQKNCSVPSNVLVKDFATRHEYIMGQVASLA